MQISRPLQLHTSAIKQRRQLKPPSAIQEHGSEALAFAAAAALGGPPLAKAVYEELVRTQDSVLRSMCMLDTHYNKVYSKITTS
jgi:hypothetical protein